MQIKSSVLLLPLIALLFVAANSSSAEGGSSDTITRLPSTKHTLIDGIEQAEKSGGRAISAKFEVENGKFWLSVYTAKEGLKPDAEHNTLMEFKGEADKSEWKPMTEVFQDKPHVARSAMHLTVLQVSSSSLIEAIRKASAVQSGTVYSAIPTIRNGQPTVTVALATPEGKSALVAVDLRTGKAERN
jgi:hypothetical protein